jgi:hypothetical protein
MRRLVTAALVMTFGLVVGMARAEDKADPTGTWKWSVERNGQTIDFTLKLKVEGKKVTGTLGRGDNETKIEEGTYKDGEVSFKVTRERNGEKFTTTYTGKVDGDTLKGKSEFERNGEKMKRDFEAKRSKD